MEGRRGLPTFLLMGFMEGKKGIVLPGLFDFGGCGQGGETKLDKCMFHQG